VDLTRNNVVVSELWMGYQVYTSYNDSNKDRFSRIFDNWCRSRKSCRSSEIIGVNTDIRVLSLVYLQEVLVALDLLLDFNLGSDEQYQQYKIPSFRENTAGLLSLPIDTLFDVLAVPPEIAPPVPFEIMFWTVKPMYELFV